MIYFREAPEPHVSANETDKFQYWYIEYRDDEFPTSAPVGIAFVLEAVGQSVQMQFIFVADQWRRRGIGSQLLQAVRERWPEVMWTGAMDEAGSALLRSAGMIDE